MSKNIYKSLNIIKNELPKINRPQNLPIGLSLITLGGTNEIGMNFNLVIDRKENNFECMILDAGISNINSEFGVHVIYPDFTFLENFPRKTKFSIVCTHGHLDHIGAIGLILKSKRFKEEKISIYGSNFTLEVVKANLQSEKLISKLDFKPQKLNNKFQVGNFEIKFVNITHSIPEATAIVLYYGNLKILHNGDWKLDEQPVLGEVTDLESLKEDKFDLFLCDSTSSLKTEGRSGSETQVFKAIEKCFDLYKDKFIIFCCFASNISRLESIRKAAEKYGRKVIIKGRSLDKMYKAAKKCNLVPENVVINSNLESNEDLTKIALIATGSQGEEGSALSKLLDNIIDLKSTNILRNAVVFFSSRVIPGLGQIVLQFKHLLISAGAKIIDQANFEDTHVSGHPSAIEIKEILEKLYIKQVMPVHGTSYNHRGVVDICEQINIPSIVVFNGCVVSYDETNKNFTRIGTVNTCVVYIDGKSSIKDFYNTQLFKIRKQLAENGIIIVSLKNNKISIDQIGVIEDNIFLGKFHKEKSFSLKDLLEEEVNIFLKNNQEASGEKLITDFLTNKFFHFFLKKPLIKIVGL